MVSIINGPNGMYVLCTIFTAVVCFTSITLYGMRHGYETSITYGSAQLFLSKA